jgi:DNA anti-recombination protein RmuC
MYRMGWTDERMDEFARHTDQRFDAIDKRLDRLDDRFDGLQRTLLLTGGGIIATLIAGIISLVVTQV